MKKRESLREKIDSWKETLKYGAGVAAIVIGGIAIRITQGTAEDIAKKEEERRKKFFADYPGLELNRWSIPVELYHPEVAVEIVDSVSVLFDDVTAHHYTQPPECFYFYETGKVDTELGECITAEAMQYHLASVVLGRSLVKGITSDDDINLVTITAQKFCKWLVAAVTVKPDLLADYTGTLIPNHPLPPAICFMRKKKWHADRMHGWK